MRWEFHDKAVEKKGVGGHHRGVDNVYCVDRKKINGKVENVVCSQEKLIKMFTLLGPFLQECILHASQDLKKEDIKWSSVTEEQIDGWGPRVAHTFIVHYKGSNIQCNMFYYYTERKFVVRCSRSW